MVLSQRISLLAGLLVAVLLVFLVVQSSVQEADTQTEGLENRAAGDEPTYPDVEGRKFETGEIIVKIEEEATQADLRDLNRQNGARTEEDLPRSDVNLVDLPPDLTVREAVREYEASPDVEYAQPNYLLYPSKTANDTYYANYLYGLNNTGQTVNRSAGTPDADIDAPEAWDTTTGSQGTVVAVIDEGVDVNHPDLRDNIWRNPGEVAGNNVDDDRNGYVDDINGWDFANDDASVYDPDPITGEGDEHGTHVAGTIAAQGNNGSGVTGVNWDAQIMSLKFLGASGGSTIDAVAAINYAVNKGVKISNNSWGGGGYNQALYDAIKRADGAGHLFVAAAGNGGTDGVGDNNDTTPQYPANYNLPNVISVAATNNKDTLASFSNFGATSVDLAAPGVDTVSTYPEGYYGYMSGTSMATPHVTGVAALLKSQDPAMDDAQMKSRILGSVDTKTSLQGKVATNGRLNAAGALGQSAVQEAPAPTPAPAADTTRPTVTSVKPRSGSKTRDRTPAIAATVRDDRTNLAKSNIRLYVDGRLKAFKYNTGTDRLTTTSGKLSFGRHKVKIVARDAAGNTTTVNSVFTVLRPR